MSLHEDPLATSGILVTRLDQVRISRKEIFNAVANKIGLSVDEERVVQLGEIDFLARLRISGIPTKSLPVILQTKEFYGDYSFTESLAIESAYSEALQQLEATSVVEINDYNYEELARTKKKLFSATAWRMFAEDNEAYLRTTLNNQNEECKKALAAIDAIIDENLKILPVALVSDPGVKKETELLYTGPSDLPDALHALGKSLVELRKQIACLGCLPDRVTTTAERCHIWI